MSIVRVAPTVRCGGGSGTPNDAPIGADPPAADIVSDVSDGRDDPATLAEVNALLGAADASIETLAFPGASQGLAAGTTGEAP